MMNGQSRRGIVALILVCVVVATIVSLVVHVFDDTTYEVSSSKRRYLTTEGSYNTTNDDEIYSWAERNLHPLTEPPQPDKEVSMMWHIPKSGGTTVVKIYECLNLTIANRAGSLPKFHHDKDKEIVAFRPWGERGPSYVNVDTSRPKGIEHAAKLGLVPSNKADIIFTGFPRDAIELLYDEKNRGRAMGVFRHPIHRLVSKFYYLGVADWEGSYQPQWKDMDIDHWASKVNRDNEHMVKKLAGKRQNEKVNEEDLQLAMQTVKSRFVVGVLDHMEESIHRFNAILGIDETTDTSKDCLDQFFRHGSKKSNSNTHAEVSKEDTAYQVLAEKNPLDIRLYNFIVDLFEEQRDVIKAYSR